MNKLVKIHLFQKTQKSFKGFSCYLFFPFKSYIKDCSEKLEYYNIQNNRNFFKIKIKIIK